MTTYEIITTDLGTEIIKRTDESGAVAWIPIDLGNSDYQAYLNKDKPVEHFTPMVSDEAPSK
jgi:hypothetical protein